MYLEDIFKINLNWHRERENNRLIRSVNEINVEQKPHGFTSNCMFLIQNCRSTSIYSSFVLISSDKGDEERYNQDKIMLLVL